MALPKKNRHTHIYIYKLMHTHICTSTGREHKKLNETGKVRTGTDWLPLHEIWLETKRGLLLAHETPVHENVPQEGIDAGDHHQENPQAAVH